MPLSEEVSLDIEEALRGISTIEDALGSAAQSFKVALAEALDVLGSVTVEDVDASAVTSGIDAAIEAASTMATVEVDTASVTTAIDEAVQASDTTLTPDVITEQVTAEIEAAVAAASPVVTPEVNAGEATEELSRLTGEASGAAISTEGVQRGLEGVSGAASLASGDLAGVVATLGSISVRGSAIAGSLLAIGGAIGVSIDAALDATTANTRFERSLGGVAERVRSLGIEGFADDLDELAERTGNSTEALLSAASGIADLGRSAGAVDANIASTAENVLLLATRAAVLNPQLGEAGDVAERLGLALQRGGSVLARQFSIVLSETAEQAEAVRLGIAGNVAELDPFTREMVRASAAARQLGGTLQNDIVAGAGQPAIQLRRLTVEFKNTLAALGQPLLGPIIQAAQEGQPILIDLATLLGDLAGVVLPKLIDTLSTATPAIHATAVSLGGLFDILGPLVNAWAALPAPITSTVFALAALKRLGAIDAIVSLTGSLGLGGLATAAARTALPIAVATGGLVLLAQAASRAATDIRDIEDAIGTGGDALAEFDQQVEKAQGGLRAGGSGLPASIDLIGQLAERLDFVSTKGEAADKVFKNLARSNPAAAAKLVEAFKIAGRDVGSFEEILRGIPGAAGATGSGLSGLAGGLDEVAAAAQAADVALGAAFGFAGDLFSAQQGAVDAGRAVRDAEEAVAEARKGGAGASKSATERALEYRQAQLGIAQAQSGLIDANEALTESQQKLNDIYVVTEDELKAIEDAQRSLEQAQRGYRDATDRVTEAQQRLLEVTRAATAAEADKARRDVRRAELSEADAIDRLEDAQKRADAANLALSRSAGRSQKVRDAAAENASDAERELAKAQLDVADASDRKREAGVKADDQLDGTIGTTEQITEAQKALETALQSQADAALAVAEAQKGVAAAQAATVVTAKELHDAEREVEKAQLAQQAAALAVAQAEQGVQTSQSGSTTSSHSLRNALEQLEAARARQVQSIIAVQNALASADGSEVTHREQIQNTIDAYRAFSLTLEPGSPLKRNVDALIVSLEKLLRPTEVKIEADTKPARRSINDFIADINRSLFTGPAAAIPSLRAGGTGLPSLDAAGLAEGTDFWPGGLTVVGERGRELVALPRGSSVTPNNQTEQFLAGMGGTTNITVNEVANDPQATAFAVGARLGAASQR